MKRLVISIFAVCMFFAATEAKAFDFGAGVGAYIPMGDARDIYNVGYNINAFVSKDIVPMVDARLFGNYYRATGSKNGQDYELTGTGGGAMVMVTPPVPIITPYVGLGYAVHNTRSGVRGHTSSDWGHGVFAQAGVNMSLLIASIGVSGTYFINNVSGNNYGGFAAGLNVGIGF